MTRSCEIKTNRGADTDPGVPFVNIAARKRSFSNTTTCEAKVALEVFLFRAVHTVVNNDTTDI